MPGPLRWYSSSGAAVFISARFTGATRLLALRVCHVDREGDRHIRAPDFDATWLNADRTAA